jgi:hypothetical protein
MNNTKWEELRLAMYSLGKSSPVWRTKDVENGYLCDWDGDWFYHFKDGGFQTIEWAEIKIENPSQHSAVLQVLRQIHVPMRTSEFGFKVFGYVNVGEAIEYAF